MIIETIAELISALALFATYVAVAISFEVEFHQKWGWAQHCYRADVYYVLTPTYGGHIIEGEFRKEKDANRLSKEIPDSFVEKRQMNVTFWEKYFPTRLERSRKWR